AHAASGPCNVAQSRGVAEGSGRGADLVEGALAGAQRRPASGRHLPHGQRSEDLRRESLLPASRRRQRLRHGRQRAPEQRRLQSRADHHGGRLLRVEPPDAALEGDEVRMKRLWLLAIVLAPGMIVPVSNAYYPATKGEGCTGCHEMRPVYETWKQSSHRNIACLECHGGVRNEPANARRLAKHMSGNIPEQIRLKGLDVVAIMDRCKSCHQQEFAQWQAGPHGAPFAKIFIDKTHNAQRLLMDDCLRCHGSYYEGGVRDLVTPVDTKGPWTFRDAQWTDQPIVPCYGCHRIHQQGEPSTAGRVHDPE